MRTLNPFLSCFGHTGSQLARFEKIAASLLLALMAAVPAFGQNQPQPELKFPIVASQEDSFPDCGGHMQTDTTISRKADGSGQLTARTHIWESMDLRGFHGAVAVVLLDASKGLLWVSKTQNYSVDGTKVPGGRSDRQENWTDTIPAQQLAKARHLAIKQTSVPPQSVTQVHIRLPLHADQEDNVGDGFHMRTEIDISRNADGSGHLHAHTHTWSTSWVSGFTGAAAVAVLDANRTVLWASEPRRFGIDAKKNRYDDWDDTIPGQVLAGAGHIAIAQKHDPKVRIDLSALLQGVENIAKGIQTDATTITKNVDKDLNASLRKLESNVNELTKELGPALKAIETEAAKIAKDVRQDADHLLNGLPVSGLELTPPVTPVPDELCQANLNTNSPGGLLASESQPSLAQLWRWQVPAGMLSYDYHWPPAEMLADPKIGVVENDGRLNARLTNAASLRDAKQILARAVTTYLGGFTDPIHGGALTLPPDPKFGIALAQLAVTGRAAFGTFTTWHPQDADLVQYVRQSYTNHQFDAAALQAAAKKLLDIAYTALWAIRANDAHWRSYRSQLGWIAASGEDDLPHRPVNVPTAHYPQYDVPVTIMGQTIQARYIMASATSKLHIGVQQTAPPPNWNARSIPSDHPAIPPQNRIILYLHGGGSRAEEAVPLAEQLIEKGSQAGQIYTVISFDMLNSGYSSPFDFSDPGWFAPGASRHPQGDTHKPLPADLDSPTYGYPLMDTEEQFILNFIDALENQIGNVKSRIEVVMGGSLGGNMSFRLACRQKSKYPFLKNIVSWSVTCMAGYQGIDVFGKHLAGQEDLTGHLDPSDPSHGGLIERFKQPETTNARHEFFHYAYAEPLTPSVAVGSVTAPGLPAQPEMWYRDDWPCKKSFVVQTLFDRYEYYTQQYRQWFLRLNYEMTIFSFQEGPVYVQNRAQGPPRYLSASSRILLASGEKDESQPLYTVYSSTQDVAQKMANTSGRTLYLRDTGHSIHDERPAFFARQIVNFLHPPPRFRNIVANITTGDGHIRHQSQAWVSVTLRSGTLPEIEISPALQIGETDRTTGQATIPLPHEIGVEDFVSFSIRHHSVQRDVAGLTISTDGPNHWHISKLTVEGEGGTRLLTTGPFWVSDETKTFTK